MKGNTCRLLYSESGPRYQHYGFYCSLATITQENTLAEMFVCLFVFWGGWGSGGGSSTHNFFSFVTTTRSVIFTYSLCLNDTHHGTVVRTKEGNVGISLRVAPLLCSVLRPSQTRTTPGRHANSDRSDTSSDAAAHMLDACPLVFQPQPAFTSSS